MNRDLDYSGLYPAVTTSDPRTQRKQEARVGKPPRTLLHLRQWLVAHCVQGSVPPDNYDDWGTPSLFGRFHNFCNKLILTLYKIL